MKVSGEHRFDAPPAEVWEALLDPEVLAATMPGCQKLELTGENQYEGVLDIKVGPVQGRFQGKVQLSEIDPPNGYTMQLDGQGAPGFVKATARVTVEPDGDSALLGYDGDAQVGGRIASVGQRLLDSSARSIIKQSLEGLGAQIAARQSAGDGGEQEVPAPAAPSQAEFAARVAKDVAGDLVPRPVWIGALIVLVLVLLYFLLR